MTDQVNHPAHYAEIVPGIECIDVTQHFNFNRGNAIKYLWRAGAKGDELEDLRKAAKYLEFEIARVTAERERARADMRSGMLSDLGLDPGAMLGEVQVTRWLPLGEEPKRRPMPGARIIPLRPRRPWRPE